MKNLQEYLIESSLLEGSNPKIPELANEKCKPSDIESLFKVAGINADVKLDKNWGQMNMVSDKYAPKSWKSILTESSYAFTSVKINIPAKYLDKLYKLMQDKFGVDIENLTRNFDRYAYLSHNFSYPTWRDSYGGPDKMCMCDYNGIYVFIHRFLYDDSKGNTLEIEDCKNAGNGDILKGAHKLVGNIEIYAEIFVNISNSVSDNFVYNIPNAGGSNDCLGKPIHVDDLVVYQTSTGLEVGKVLEIKGKNISVLINNGFGETVVFNNGKKMCVINLLVK